MMLPSACYCFSGVHRPTFIEIWILWTLLWSEEYILGLSRRVDRQCRLYLPVLPPQNRSLPSAECPNSRVKQDPLLGFLEESPAVSRTHGCHGGGWNAVILAEDQGTLSLYSSGEVLCLEEAWGRKKHKEPQRPKRKSACFSPLKGARN